MEETKLYHCTDFESLFNILKSEAFWPSYCYERTEYLNEPTNFAFAMVCFADLLDVEVKTHLKKFKKNCFIQMNKEWAKNNGLSNVIYYNRESVVSALFLCMINDIAERMLHTHKEISNEVRFTSMMMAYFKQYEGYYWNDKKNQWSQDKTQFYTEREWRYVPLVQNYEAFYLDPEEFHDKDFREKKRNELIKHGYTLDFTWNDIESIGVHNKKQREFIIDFLTNTCHHKPAEVKKKVRKI